MEFDTIVAISTPIGTGGIGIVRISGKNAFDIAQKLIRSRKYKTVKDIPTRYAALVDVYDGDEFVDEAILIKFKSPNSYTGEDVVEIQSHGGMVVLKRILEAAIKSGARHAMPGEFTKRAFLNGRIDLSQAEAVIDIINSKTRLLQQNAAKQLKGMLSQRIEEISQLLLNMVASIEASIDFSEHEVDEVSKDEILFTIDAALAKIEKLIKSYETGKAIKSGIYTVIVGRPNVGKSSLLNRLLKEEKAIVTDIPGTTRDVIEEVLDIEGVPIILADTAGVRKTEDIVEKIGVKKTLESIERADLVLFMVESSGILQEDLEIFEAIKNKRFIVIVNKIDKEVKVSQDDIKRIFGKEGIFISVERDKNLELVEKAIANEVLNQNIETHDSVLITNLRHKELLLKAKEFLVSAKENMYAVPLDILSIDIKNALDSLYQITGKNVTEDMVDRIFSMFCIGK
ncbi:tRNA modification GTPase [Caldicellulosiruptor bescii]|uniref:tRNA modification GTPase MnmE n=2 Tax=Caldicellulosiruptor bescii TaxID=31899 RepID=B9MQF3_CALBD|nr:tRNA uridine-5-carboxymethylaminomethyl(34) synthesis GTPase MnmE [Caldicellulosiruptor bescii]ACM61810.1 tRNA modification GTPase TrmE [Caldicellulosiruptor bescii DSM 6725]PBC88391.1 tRNA modification GTPase [Caldicellulosiruptor bescii]PBC92128.1 tRNA modification GTPase [Caldicellulosiruptor bescii]PBD05062.1 tRNA modification GTPase [Caldicellulosiruptor bescii]PBD05307.1 tRNA modification GTPase [Caldicellulosiruptor bescii]